MAERAWTVREELKKDGYSKEEEYFYKENRKLIEQRRKALDAQRAATQAENEKRTHWMKCPKCGGDMKNENLFQIQVEQCPNCHGIYMDEGELQTLLHVKKPDTFLSRLGKIIHYRERVPKIF